MCSFTKLEGVLTADQVQTVDINDIMVFIIENWVWKTGPGEWILILPIWIWDGQSQA